MKYVAVLCYLLWGALSGVSLWAEASSASDDALSLNSAAGAGDLAQVNELIAAGADVDEQDIEGNTPLMEAIGIQHIAIIRALLSAGADPNIPNIFGDTPLLAASYERDLYLMAILINNGADVNLYLPGEYFLILQPLHLAAWNGDVRMTEILLAFGTNPDVRGYGKAAGKLTPIKRAVLGATNPTPNAPTGKNVDHAGTVRILLGKGADICSNGDRERLLDYVIYAEETFDKNVKELKQVLKEHRC